MKIDWTISSLDIEKTLNFINEMSSKNYVKKRIKENVTFPIPNLSRKIMWEGMFDCLLSSQQKSGPDSAIANFLNQKPFPLSYEICVEQKNVQEFIKECLQNHGGIRFINNIGKYAESNLKWFKNNGWIKFEEILSPLIEQRKNEPQTSHIKTERDASHKINDALKGFGPKQSRNYLQLMGLTRYEIPIDSRVMKWLNDNGFNIDVTKTELTRKYYYDKVLDKIQELCDRGNILPCILDACIFASFDSEWDENKIPF